MTGSFDVEASRIPESRTSIDKKDVESIFNVVIRVVRVHWRECHYCRACTVIFIHKSADTSVNHVEAF